MNITNYLKAGFGSIFIETTEIKRAVKSIEVDDEFNIIYWNPIRGIITDFNNLEKDKPCSNLEILKMSAIQFNRIAVILENYDQYISNSQVAQSFLNFYDFYKANQVCLVIVGSFGSVIPPQLKEFIPILEFNLPNEKEIETIITGVSETITEEAKKMLKANKFTQEEYDEIDYSVTKEIIETCKGMTYEEIENIVSYSAITQRKFDLFTILDKKRHSIKQTGFLNFLPIEPIDVLGGLDYFKNYMIKRTEPFKNSNSIKPKLRSVLLVGFQGTGKSLAVKVTCSIFGWPGLILDLGALKGGIVGETERNTRIATKIIDAFGKCIVGIDEIEKSFAGTGGKGYVHETTEATLSHMLTWMQERTSEGILIATANNLEALPPEFLRAGRWDTIFFVNLPNPKEIKIIIDIHNKKYNSKLPTTNDFCEKLYDNKWSGAEIEQLAKDIHYEDSLENAMKQIPILAQYRSKDLESLKEKASHFRLANEPFEGNLMAQQISKLKLKRSLNLGSPNSKLN